MNTLTTINNLFSGLTSLFLHSAQCVRKTAHCISIMDVFDLYYNCLSLCLSYYTILWHHEGEINQIERETIIFLSSDIDSNLWSMAGSTLALWQCY